MLALSADLGMDCSRHRFQLQDVGMDTIQEKRERAVVAFADWYSAPSIHRISHFAGMARRHWPGAAGNEQSEEDLSTVRARLKRPGRLVQRYAHRFLLSVQHAEAVWRNDAQPPACVSSVARPT